MNAESSSKSGSPADPRTEALPDSAAHFTVAVLRAYRARRLSADEVARVRKHLAECAECRELAVDVSAFFDPLEPGEVEEEIDKGASWKRLEETLGREEWFEARRQRRRRLASQALFLAAAMVALAVAGLSQILGYGATGKVLVPVGAFKGPREEIAAVRLPILLKLSLSAVDDSPTYRVDLFDGAGSKIRSFGGLQTDPSGRLRLRLRRWLLKPGRYHLEARADPGRPGGSFDEFEFEVVSH